MKELILVIWLILVSAYQIVNYFVIKDLEEQKESLKQENQSLKFEVQTTKYLLEHQRNMTEMYKRMFEHVIKVSDENAKDN